MEKTENGDTILYINKYYEKDLTSGTVTTYYYLADRLVAQRTGGTLDYIHQDSLGSTSVVSDSSGALVSSIAYFPFGDCRESPPYPTDKLFTGQRLDDTGLYYYNARYYDPTIGRFISPDTHVQNDANPQSLNRYTYVFNNPLIYTDPTGNFGWQDITSAANHVITVVSSGLNVAVSKTVEVAQTAGQYATTAAQASGRGVVQGSVTVTGIAVTVAQSSGEGAVNRAIDYAAGGVLNNTVVPLANQTGAGINSIEVNSSKGYIETDISTGGWMNTAQNVVNSISGVPAAGITIPTPIGSAVFINQTEANAGSGLATYQRHEETHVIQQDVFSNALRGVGGSAGWLGLYYLGQWAYGGYDPNPFEVQARQNSDPSMWTSSQLDWWESLPW